MPNTVSTFNIAKALSQFDIEIEYTCSNQITNDSRQVTHGDVFCAVIGSESDGRQFIDQAIAAGAVLVIAQCHHQQQHGNVISRSVESISGEVLTAQIVQFYELNEKLFELAAHYYHQPVNELSLIGVTGTNGKTSTTQIIASLLEHCGKKSAVIGTTGAGSLNSLAPIANTTPGPTELNHLMAGFVEQKIQHVAMEVSSHALDQGRILPSQLDVAVFTNLSRDHLDYHQTMEEYAAAKFSIFSGSAGQTAIINGDDVYGQQWLTLINQPSYVYGRSGQVKTYEQFVYGSNISLSEHGITFTIETSTDQVEVTTQLLGMFNIDNLLAAIATMLALGFSLKDISPAIEKVEPSQGRMEAYSTIGMATAVVDYAHTPDALENALMACREHCQGELWVVFGCGGDRDKGKRAQMGAIAEKYAEHVVITNDNPRSEAPELIANDILSGCSHTEKITVMLDRKQAVRSAIAHAKAEDLVLLAGKGHENNIEIAGQIIEYSERAVVKSLYQAGERP
ncbi:UDP-N-acetylmuramoyl-L-alanyl-D-glutamate--2,6-diaminopimelate ligase [Thalassotalea sp. M1531]|uniref:UDP-N-acetylmuramoyl-L-alanyl-D-glutamate--2,6-diaminopimelate ligase n=1 Tax=Thalassotalea algicola TaxID=2716224 RepID=A0A7Y0LE74_9GAMM|nr:UDP-N-acetylmuramoyl-L-alanyl-D-glutamate--2,6-diaminopimelate ligase [Thalassotalea algicola]NMP32041.1 UDP-N-acetylmuramoyl-L-alanyl-D-glutamate--2,6-diaminopimelate ligase [Thalassotalea algicola]